MEGNKKHGVAGRNKSTSSSSSSSSSNFDSNSNSILDELSGRKETSCNYNPKVKSSSSSNSPVAGAGYFSTVFPHPNPDPYHLAGNDTSHSDLYWTLNRHHLDGKTNGKSSKNQLPSYSSYTKDGKAAAYSTESAESSHFGSSVHYGARDFYATSPSNYAPPELPTTHKNDDNNDDSVATRGDWWQGSLYY